ncbi:hypothetical protein JOD63_001504 [Microbacterium terrae]|uniref:Uncharacterized protein n=1 Tax=Microbacterium terrae TaxID=69369 RepID=A0A0M2H219_9MICO|nr:hypothetical protein [Microbacterium terrae]KJL38123.1 hypothetical protein RS81_03121 [Microbacterium terrae]MBP1077536.1 hypothetical protein [Microbacterium terrae]GLJ99141.1 hypothetical protein GCM10017594_23380 [Microbacterium terrae]
MTFLARFRRKPYRAVTEEEQVGRYLYLLGTLPASVIESAHATAFAQVPPERRREMFDQLRPFMSEAEQRSASDDPVVLARVLRRMEERRAARAEESDGVRATQPATTQTATLTGDAADAMGDPRSVLFSAGVMALVAQQFLVSSAVATYFTVGGGSVGIANEPTWVGDTYAPETSFDGGMSGADFGGGFDGGALGGFEGGMGGGFDGGGGSF